MDKNTKSMIGKTIKEVIQQSDNCWILEFTDGTRKVLWSEITGIYGLSEILVSDTL